MKQLRETREQSKQMAETEKYVDTNMGTIPLKDYLEIIAIQHGFDSYEDMKANGYEIYVPGAKEHLTIVQR